MGFIANELVRTMTYKIYGAFVASLSVLALMVATNETFARSGTAVRGGFTPAHAMAHPSVGQSLRHFRRRNAALVWASGDPFYGSGYGDAGADVTQPTSGDVHYTTTYDVPWDWAHRFPPMVSPSDRPYVPSCPTEAVTVTGRNGKEQTVNVTRCF
jgi:hypothetical protein